MITNVTNSGYTSNCKITYIITDSIFSAPIQFNFQTDEEFIPYQLIRFYLLNNMSAEYISRNLYIYFEFCDIRPTPWLQIHEPELNKRFEPLDLHHRINN